MKIIKKRYLGLKRLEGNLLFYNHGRVTCTEEVGNTLFVCDEAENKEGAKQEFVKYVYDFFSICGKLKEKPAIMYFDDLYQIDEVRARLGKKYLICFTKDYESNESERMFLKYLKYNINSKWWFAPFIYAEQYVDHKDLFEEILHNRELTALFNSQKLFIIIPDLEGIELSQLEKLLKLGQNGNIYFIILIKDKKKFVDTHTLELYEQIASCCQVIFDFKGGKVSQASINLHQETMAVSDDECEHIKVKDKRGRK